MNPTYDTATMAELYAQQGHVAEARGIYQRLAEREPQNPTYRRRLQELSGNQGGPVVFRQEMEKIVQGTPGALACTVMGFDGIAIDTVEANPGVFDIASFMTEFGASIASLKRVADSAGKGGLQEVTLQSEGISAVLRILNNEYFLGTVCDSGGFTGKARFLMRLAADSLKNEF